jgi:hypothetical protein
MKTILFSLVTLLSSISFAETTDEARTVARLLINNPSVTSKLTEKGIDSLYTVKTESIKQGVSRYTLTFARNCECVPAKATVTIVEDITPTYYDGLPQYTSSIEIKEGF